MTTASTTTPKITPLAPPPITTRHAATVASLAKLAPDRVKGLNGGAVTAEWVAEVLADVSNRVRLNFGAARRDDLQHALERIGQAEWAASGAIDWAVLARAIDGVIAAVDRLQNPRTSAAAPVYALELARDLGLVDPPPTAAALLPRVAAALREADTGDKRTRIHMPAFLALLEVRDEFDPGNGDTVEAIRLRHALAGFGLPPVREDDRAYGAPAPGVLAPPRPAPSAKNPGGHDQAGRLDALVAALVPYPAEPAAEARTSAPHMAAWLVAKDAARLEAVALIDAELDAEADRAPGSLRYWWTAELRRHLALAAEDAPRFADGATALAFARSLGLRVGRP